MWKKRHKCINTALEKKKDRKKLNQFFEKYIKNNVWNEREEHDNNTESESETFCEKDKPFDENHASKCEYKFKWFFQAFFF